jgi:hypothetical protein
MNALVTTEVKIHVSIYFVKNPLAYNHETREVQAVMHYMEMVVAKHGETGNRYLFGKSW